MGAKKGKQCFFIEKKARRQVKRIDKVNNSTKVYQMDTRIGSMHTKLHSFGGNK